jgi:hypothetical protein
VGVQRRQPLAAGNPALVWVVLAADEGREPSCSNLLVEVGQVALQVVDDAVRPDRVDAGEEDESATAVWAGVPGEVANVAMTCGTPARPC